MRFVGLFALLLVVAACSDDDADTTNASNEPTETPTATSEPVPTSTSQATATPQPTATVTPEPSPEIGEANIEVTDYAIYDNNIGDASYIVGVARNTGDAYAGRLEIVASLFDESGSIIATDDTWASLNIVPTDSFTPFVFEFRHPSDTWDTVEFQTQYESVEPDYLVGPRDYFEFDAVQANWTSGDFPGMIVGQIENTGDVVAENVQVWAATYGADGEFLVADLTELDLSQIAPGETAPFSINVRATVAGYEGPEPTTIDVIAAGHRQD